MASINDRDFKIIIPSRFVKTVNDTARAMSRRFGGVTELPFVRGIWLDAKNKMVRDKNVLLFSSRALKGKKKPLEILSHDRKFMKGLAEDVDFKTKEDTIWTEEDIVKNVSFVSVPKGTRHLMEVL